MENPKYSLFNKKILNFWLFLEDIFFTSTSRRRVKLDSNLLLLFLKGSFGKSGNTSACEVRDVIYNDVIYDEKMQCQKVVEKKCFQVQETTFNIFKVST